MRPLTHNDIPISCCLQALIQIPSHGLVRETHGQIIYPVCSGAHLMFEHLMTRVQQRSCQLAENVRVQTYLLGKPEGYNPMLLYQIM